MLIVKGVYFPTTRLTGGSNRSEFVLQRQQDWRKVALKSNLALRIAEFVGEATLKRRRQLASLHAAIRVTRPQAEYLNFADFCSGQFRRRPPALPLIVFPKKHEQTDAG